MPKTSLRFGLATPGELLVEVESRLDEAGMTLARLPGGSWTPEMIEASDDLPDEIEQRRPTPAEIDRMDEALTWLSVLPASPHPQRLLVQKRLLRSVRTGRHRYSWRKLGARLGVSHHTARAWHAQAIETIAREIARPYISTSHAAHNRPQISPH